jgi:hypothetical protein
MKSISLQVDDLKAKLAIQEVELKQKNEAADALIEIVRVETQKVCAEKAIGKVHSTFGCVIDGTVPYLLVYMLCLRYSVNIHLVVIVRK